MVDGGMFLTREEGWKEVKLGRVFSEENNLNISENRGVITDSNYIAHLGSHKEFFEKFEYYLDKVPNPVFISVGSILAQIVMLDMIFSFDSILTAVGIAYQQNVILMIIAVVIAVFVMMIFAGAISRFIHKYPTMQVLALAFLILIGFMLMLEGFHEEISKGYIYFAVFFSLIVEVVNINTLNPQVK